MEALKTATPDKRGFTRLPDYLFVCKFLHSMKYRYLCAKAHIVHMHNTPENRLKTVYLHVTIEINRLSDDRQNKEKSNRERNA